MSANTATFDQYATAILQGAVAGNPDVITKSDDQTRATFLQNVLRLTKETLVLRDQQLQNIASQSNQ